MVGPLIGPIATGAGRLGLSALIRKYRKKIPAGAGATLKFVLDQMEELEDAGICPWCESDHGGGDVDILPRNSLSRGRRSSSRRFPLPTEKKKRKVSAYQKEFGRQLKRLKREHPRTPVTRLMKRAHAATRRARRGK